MSDTAKPVSPGRAGADRSDADPTTVGNPPVGSGHGDFTADLPGLLGAVHRLVAARADPGSPHPAPLPSPLPPAWPAAGVGGAVALEMLAPVALDGVTRLDHPGFLAHMDPPTPWVTWAVGLWSAAANQNLLHPDTAPQARALEQQVIGWLAPAFGMTGGQLIPGSTLANLTALWAARELTGATLVVASAAAHVSIAKAAHLLGMGLHIVATDERQRLDVDRLPADLADAVLVLTAGTTGTGAVDPLDAGAGRAAWRHVDAAWAGPLRLTRHADLLDGVQRADSVAVSAHKWLYQPKESALVLYADPARAEQALSFTSAYLAAPNVGLLGSHGAGALPLAATLLAWGRTGLAAHIEADMARAAQLTRLIAADPDFELWAPPTTGVVLWRPRAADPVDVRAHLADAWVSLTNVDGQHWWRSVAVNPHADPTALLSAARAALRQPHQSCAPAPRTLPARPPNRES